MLKIGIVGLDSTHAVEFTRLIHGGVLPAGPAARVVAACAGFDTDFPLSRERRARIANEVRALGVPVVGSISELGAEVDAIMLLSCDGRSHRREALAVFAAGKPVFVDKPLAADWREAASILRAARGQNVPCFSASALRFRPPSALADEALARPLRIEAIVPARQEPGHPELCWHGIHGLEAGYARLGAGCATVRRQAGEEDLTIGTWADGSELRVIRSTADVARTFPVRVTGPAGESTRSGVDYRPLLAAILRFFETGVAPVPVREMIEVIAFAAAADLSRDRGGEAVNLQDLIATGGS